MILAAINWHSVVFLLFALVACGFAAAVVLTSNIVRMAFYLTLSLGATSGLFLTASSSRREGLVTSMASTSGVRSEENIVNVVSRGSPIN